METCSQCFLSLQVYILGASVPVYILGVGHCWSTINLQDLSELSELIQKQF